MTHFSPFLSILLSHAGKGSAYLDPGSGSFIIQLIIASLVGAGFLIRGYWSKISAFFRGDSAETDDEQDDDLNDA
jgi:hypothetical protein